MQHLEFLVGQLLNSWVLVRMKQRSAERRLVARLIGSTGVGEVADTLIFCAIAASAIGVSTFGAFVNYFVMGVVLKVGVDNLPVSGADAWSFTKDSMTMARVGVMQEILSSGKREVRDLLPVRFVPLRRAGEVDGK